MKPRMVSSLRRRSGSVSSLTDISSQLGLIRTLRGLTRNLAPLTMRDSMSFDLSVICQVTQL